MKRCVVGLLCVFVLSVAFVAAADARCGCMGMTGQEGHGDNMPMMGCGMMCGMKHEGMGMMGGMGCGMMGAEMMDDDHPHWNHVMGLGLDDTQREAIQEIKSRVMKETIKKKADKQIAKVELKELLSKDPVDLKAIEAKLKQIESLRTDLQLSPIKAREEVKAKLTVAQREKLKKMIEMGPMGGGMGMMQGGGCSMMGGMEHGEMGGRMHDCPMMKEDKKPPMEHKH